MCDASESKKKLQCASSRPSSAGRVHAAVPEVEEGEPAMAALLAHQAERVVLAEKPLPRVVGEPLEHVEVDDAPQPAAAAEIAARVEGVEADAADLVGHRELEGERCPAASFSCW
jgi:hypothetical protein